MGQEQALEARTCLSMCRQAPQTASLSDDELEYAAGAASPPSASGSLNGSPANGVRGRQQQQQKQGTSHLTALPAGVGLDGGANAHPIGLLVPRCTPLHWVRTLTRACFCFWR